CAVRKPGRPGADHLFFYPRRCPCLGGLALALGGAVGAAVQAGEMSGRKKAKSVAPRKDAPAGLAATAGDGAAKDGAFKDGDSKDGASPGKEPRRRKRSATALEDRIGYRFKDGALLDCALTHISGLKGARNRAGSYQRLEFLGDHVLGLVIS